MKYVTKSLINEAMNSMKNSTHATFLLFNPFTYVQQKQWNLENQTSN